MNWGPVAQRLELAAHNRLVGGSIPSGPTILDLTPKRAARVGSDRAAQRAGRPLGRRCSFRGSPSRRNRLDAPSGALS